MLKYIYICIYINCLIGFCIQLDKRLIRLLLLFGRRRRHGYCNGAHRADHAWLSMRRCNRLQLLSCRPDEIWLGCCTSTRPRWMAMTVAVTVTMTVAMWLVLLLMLVVMLMLMMLVMMMLMLLQLLLLRKRFGQLRVTCRVRCLKSLT